MSDSRVKRPKSQNSAVAILESASRYVYGKAQRARSLEEHEDFSITLKLLQLLREGWASRPRIFDVACGFAVGLCHARYLHRRGERAAFMRKEFLSITPDYDYSRETVPNRDPADGRRHFGNQYASRGMDTRAIKEAAARLGITAGAIYTRLSNGWTWERAISEPRRPRGRKPYGRAFCSVDAATVAGHDSGPTGSTHEDDTPADLGFRDFPGADDRNPVPNRARAAGYAALPVADRRGTRKKRISAPAQVRFEKLSRAAHRAAADRETYFGA